VFPQRPGGKTYNTPEQYRTDGREPQTRKEQSLDKPNGLCKAIRLDPAAKIYPTSHMQIKELQCG
jgi:hypothetical protein